MAAKSNAFQFARLQGFHKGPPSKRGTVGSLLAEGLRHPTHISHILGAPRFEVIHLDGPVSEPDALPAWIEDQMTRAQNPVMVNGCRKLRAVRNDALAIGTLIASLPETMDEFDPERYAQFTEDTTEWAREFLSVAKMQLHFRLEHLDELHPHLHLWFTPEGVDDGDGTWSFSSVLGRSKGFLHKFQVNFFEEVGHKYSEFRARPLEERKKRVPRYFAVQQRDGETLDIVKRIKDGDISALREADTGVIPTSVVGNILNELDDSVLDSLPAVNRRLLALRDKNSQLETELRQLEEKATQLNESNHEMSQRISQYENAPADDIHKIARLERERDMLRQGASRFLNEGVWQHIVKSVLDSAQRNKNRAFHVSKEEWEELVIEDALPSIIPSDYSRQLDDVAYWISQAGQALRQSDIHRVANTPFSAFTDAEPVEVESESGQTSTEGAAIKGPVSRFQKAAERDRRKKAEAWTSPDR